MPLDRDKGLPPVLGQLDRMLCRPHRDLDELSDQLLVLAEDNSCHRSLLPAYAASGPATAASGTGSCTWRTDPCPNSLVAHTFPSQSWTISRTIGSPRPVPEMLRVSLVSTRE